MNEQYRKLLEELKTTAFATALTAYLDEEIEKIQDIHGIKSLKELQAKQDAEKVLRNIFSFLSNTPKKLTKTKYN